MLYKRIFIIGCGWLGLPLAISLKNAGHTVMGSTRDASRQMEAGDGATTGDVGSSTRDASRQVEAGDGATAGDVGSSTRDASRQMEAGDGATAGDVGSSTRAKSKFKELEAHGLRPFTFDFDHPDSGAMPSADVVIITVPPSSSTEYIRALSVITRHIDPNCHLIFCSTTSVYGEQDDLLCTEDMLSPGDLSSVDNPDLARHGAPRKVLIEAEGIISEHKNHTILRLAGLYGPGRHPVKYLSGRSGLSKPNAPVNLIHQSDIIQLVHALIQADVQADVDNVRSGQQQKMQTLQSHRTFDVENVRSGQQQKMKSLQSHRTHDVDNVRSEQQQNMQTLQSHRTFDVINVCSGQHPTRKDYYSSVALALGIPAPQFDLSDSSGGKIIDNQKLVKILGYDPILKDP